RRGAAAALAPAPGRPRPHTGRRPARRGANVASETSWLVRSTAGPWHPCLAEVYPTLTGLVVSRASLNPENRPPTPGQTGRASPSRRLRFTGRARRKTAHARRILSSQSDALV